MVAALPCTRHAAWHALDQRQPPGCPGCSASQQAAEADHLKSDTYKRLNLALVWWGLGCTSAFWMAPQQPLRLALGCVCWRGGRGRRCVRDATPSLLPTRARSLVLPARSLPPLDRGPRLTPAAPALRAPAPASVITTLLCATAVHAALTYQETDEQGLNPFYLARQFLSSVGNLTRWVGS